MPYLSQCLPCFSLKLANISLFSESLFYLCLVDAIFITMSAMYLTQTSKHFTFFRELILSLPSENHSVSHVNFWYESGRQFSRWVVVEKFGFAPRLDPRNDVGAGSHLSRHIVGLTSPHPNKIVREFRERQTSQETVDHTTRPENF